MKGKKIAVMQPYFFPYIGYYRLFYLSDVFVILDDVQFPRRGFVHRNKLTNYDQKEKWLTIPVNKSPMDTKIKNVTLQDNFSSLLKDQARRFPVLFDIENHNPKLSDIIFYPEKNLVNYLEKQIRFVNNFLNIECNIIKSSNIDQNLELRGQNKIINIVKSLNGNIYINLSGGRDIYSKSLFQKNKLDIYFLKPHLNLNISILERIILEEKNILKNELITGAEIEN